MSAEHDRLFIRNFSLTLVGLVLFTIVIIFAARAIHSQLEPSENPAREAARIDRLQPVAGVFAGETGRAAAAAAVAAAAAAAPQVAFDGSLDGGLIYERACASCHEVGAAGAPLMVASAWAGRLEKGMETLVANAIDGIGAMPPRGGRRDLSDEQIEISVAYMLDMLD
ncbi:MAG: cytochrome c5 family protein [Wenzhouxiangella sp.]|nr:MAG: cytochrome c5 family protein [Wenzhouxiangella sp.]